MIECLSWFVVVVVVEGGVIALCACAERYLTKSGIKRLSLHLSSISIHFWWCMHDEKKVIVYVARQTAAESWKRG
jgi:hypothetical protein